ncbi:MAG: FAD-dependent oxidoreductase [Myxococcales bacterium]|nr:FAD-dependent oxidoreductase [Myxococcales bacterium]
MKKQRTIVVVGGAQSGPTAAARARETDDGARIVLIERATEVSYAAAGLAHHLSGEVPSLAELNRETAELFRSFYDIDVRTGVEVSRIDAKQRRVEAGGETLEYDALIYALGADSVVPALLDGASNVFRFRTLKDLEGIVSGIDAGKRRIAILGGGFFGVEAADGLLRRKCEVVLVEQGPRLLSSFSPTVSGMASAELGKLGARVLTGATLADVQRSGTQVTALVLASGERIPVELVVATAGIVPRTELLRHAGAKLLRDGSVAVDERMRSSLAGVYACGVCASVEHAVTGKRALVAQASIADKTAQIAGANAAGAKHKMPPVLGTAILRVGELVCARTGLSLEGAKKGVALTRVHAPSHDPWFPASSPISIELLHDSKTGRLLGADLAGQQGVDKRVDVLATALSGGLTVDELASLDLAYAPAFSAARDPVNVVASVAAATKRGLAQAVSPAELNRARGELVLVDVRANGSALAGAIRLPLSALRARFGELPGTGRLVFVDESGRGGYLAARIAVQRGRAQAGYLSGGLRSLELELEQGAQ